MTGPDLALTETTQTETVRLFAQGRPAGMPTSAPLGRGSAVGRYVVLDVVGSGGMGVVYAGYDPELDRKVALKLLRPDRLGASPEAAERARVRLLREAQAIARLSHPNVVAVHDTGTLGGQVFIAMEFIEGRTLRRWLDEERRPLRQVLDVLLLAGRGLAAAHAAGLVHRDFKPENVLLGDDGRVRVADFGLARVEDAEGEAGGGAMSETRGWGSLTEGGFAVGTPGYMAPEQFRGEPSDARSDQFGFCVTLYEALYGERPFAGETAQEIAAAAARGVVNDPPAGSRVPAWLRQALLQGLRPDPADRHPSMDSLLAELSRDPAAIRRRWLMAVVLAAAAGSGLFAWQAGERRQLCQGAEVKLAGVWDAGRKAAVRTAFLKTGVPFAARSWALVERSLDRYAAGWSAMHRETCEATRLRGEQSEELMDRRMFCLDQRLREAGALVDLFASADAEVVAKSGRAAAGLGRLDACADVAALTSRVPPPADAEVRAEVGALTRELSRAKALRAAGRFQKGVEVARTVAARSAKVAYPPLRAEALFVQGDLEERAGEFDAAEKTLREAVWSAEAAVFDEVKAAAAIKLLRVNGENLGRFEPAHEWGRFAAASIERLGGEPSLKAEYLNQLGVVYEEEGKYPQALARQRESLEIRRRLPGISKAELAASIADFGVVLFQIGRYPEALASFEEALALQKDELGAQHPEVGSTLNRIGGVLYTQGRYEESVVRLREALAIREAALGPVHRLVADTLNNLANSLDLLTRYEEALACYQRALEIQRQVFGDRHPDLARSLDNIGAVYSHRRMWKEALDYHRQALDMRDRTVGRNHPKTSLTLHNVGNAYMLQGRYEEALPWVREALAVREKTLELDHPWVAEELVVLADLERRLGRPEKVVERLERALKILEAQELEPGIVARARFALAQALWETGGGHERAVRLARQARADFASLGEQDRVALDEVVQWLAKNDAKGGTA
ncbi:MAG TPA: serine/threonine-protein kinase [Thermoanaerobaculia bacterium]